MVYRVFFIAFLFLLNGFSLFAQNNTAMSSPTPDFKIPFELNSNETATYLEAIAHYKKLAQAFPQLELKDYGQTDSGFPLHLAILSKDRDFSAQSIKNKGKGILMINNAIHPGEPCGVDASMMLVRDYLMEQQKMDLLEDYVVVIIPFYNIGGGLNRNSGTRANQNGPVSYGFRGNARNLDLNRDFIKCDSRNAQTFNQIFGEWQPDVFIDNHTSNGADYQYTMTLIPTQHNKLAPTLAEVLQQDLLPSLYKSMKKDGWEMTPYVYAQDTPDGGIAGFLDHPRYSSGYASLFNTLSFMPETHMLKPFKDRVASTYAFMDAMIQYLDKNGKDLQKARQEAMAHQQSKKVFDLNWTVDMEAVDSVLFKGYEAKYKASAVSGLNRLYYDRDAPYEKNIPFFNTYKSTLSVEKPIAYILPQAYGEVIERMKWNGVRVERLAKDQEVNAEFYRIRDYKTGESPYEGHYLHSQVEVEKENLQWLYHEGDYVIFVDQAVNRYIVETLEPQAPDSWFAWNFFDGILAQKEYFSSYVFEDLASQYLAEDPELRKALEAKKLEDPKFAKSARAQLNFVYQHSPHYEPTHRLYPVGRIVAEQDLKLRR